MESTNRTSDNVKTDNIKAGADLLMKGGTLLGNSCENCGGVQIKLKENIICISCGREVKELTESSQTDNPQTTITTDNPKDTSTIQNKTTTVTNDYQINQNNHTTNVENHFIYNDNVKCTKIIIHKILYLISSLQEDEDFLNQNNKLDLVKKYLDILDRLQHLLKRIHD